MLEAYDDVMTADEVCEALRIGYNSLYSILSRGDLKAYKIGRNWRVPKEAVKLFIMEQARL